MGIVPSPRQRVFPFFGTLQLLPSSRTSLKWYHFPKTDIQLSKYGLPASDNLPAFRRLARSPFHCHYSSTTKTEKQALSDNCNHFVTTLPVFGAVLLTLFDLISIGMLLFHSMSCVKRIYWLMAFLKGLSNRCLLSIPFIENCHVPSRLLLILLQRFFVTAKQMTPPK